MIRTRSTLAVLVLVMAMAAHLTLAYFPDMDGTECPHGSGGFLCGCEDLEPDSARLGTPPGLTSVLQQPAENTIRVAGTVDEVESVDGEPYKFALQLGKEALKMIRDATATPEQRKNMQASKAMLPRWVSVAVDASGRRLGKAEEHGLPETMPSAVYTGMVMKVVRAPILMRLSGDHAAKMTIAAVRAQVVAKVVATVVDKLALAPNSVRVTEPSQVLPNGDVGVLVDIDDNSNLSEAEWSAAMKSAQPAVTEAVVAMLSEHPGSGSGGGGIPIVLIALAIVVGIVAIGVVLVAVRMAGGRNNGTPQPTGHHSRPSRSSMPPSQGFQRSQELTPLESANPGAQ